MVERLVEEGIKKGVTDERAKDLGSKDEMKSFVDKVAATGPAESLDTHWAL